MKVDDQRNISLKDIAKASGVKLKGHHEPGDSTPCNHGISFDQNGAEKLSPWEVSEKYPRFSGVCEYCGYTGVYYASLAHMMAGGW